MKFTAFATFFSATLHFVYNIFYTEHTVYVLYKLKHFLTLTEFLLLMPKTGSCEEVGGGGWGGVTAPPSYVRIFKF